MGFIVLSFWCRTFVRYYMTIFIVNGFWRNGGLVAYGALDQSSQEQTVPYFENHNHVHDHHNNAHDDGWCDCNAQGPWHPLFKPSQALQTSSEDASPPLENAIDASEHGQVHALPGDLHAGANAKLRKAKKQNHMIHLHLIPHIYVPVLHPVRHPVSYSVENSYHHHHPQQQPSSQEGQHDSRESHPYSFEPDDTRSSVSPDHDNELGGGQASDHSAETLHHDDHSPFVPPEPAEDVSSQEVLNQDAPNYVNSHSLVDTSSHESEETNYNSLPDVNYRYPPHHSYNSEEHPSSSYHHHPAASPPAHAYNSAEEHPSSSYHHQYQVHEDSPHEHYYGDYPSSSNTKTQILPLNSSGVNYFKQKAKQKYHDRSRLNKKYMILPLQMKKLRVMRPPPPAQVETWRTNMQYADSKLVPLKAYFDSKDLFKHPFFDFKAGFKPTKYRLSMMQPMLGNTIPSYSQSGAGKPIPLPPAGHTNHFKSPILVYPTNALRKRQDKVLRS